MKTRSEYLQVVRVAPSDSGVETSAARLEELSAYPDVELIGGRHTYGQSIGVLVTNKYKARIPGDIGNAETFDFPVRYAVVPEMHGENHRRADPSLIPAFIRTAKALEEEGVRAITTSCGFLAYSQDALAKSVNVPVFTSSLLLIPLVSAMAGGRGRVGVITVEAKHLDESYFTAVGADSVSNAEAGTLDAQRRNEPFE